MVIHIGRVTVPGPGDALDTVRSVTSWGAETTKVLADLPTRASTLLTELELVVRQLNDIADRADRLVTRVDAIATDAERATLSAQAVADHAAGVTAAAGETTEGAGGLLADAGEMSRRAGEVRLPGVGKLRGRGNRDERPRR